MAGPSTWGKLRTAAGHRDLILRLSANTDIVCSMDAECSYDPHQLEAMLPLPRDGVDV